MREVGLGASITIFKNYLQNRAFEGCFNLFPGKYRGNKCIATMYQHVNIEINIYEVAIMAYTVF